MSAVIVIADKYGCTVSLLSDDKAFVTVKQLIEVKNSDGSYSRSARQAIIVDKINVLENYKEGMELPGKIVIKESLTPFIDVAKNRLLEKRDGTKYYKKYFYTEDYNIKDEYI